MEVMEPLDKCMIAPCSEVNKIETIACALPRNFNSVLIFNDFFSPAPYGYFKIQITTILGKIFELLLW